MALSVDEIQSRFGKHAAAIEGPNPHPAHQLLRDTFVSFVEMLNEVLPDSRDTSLAMTSLEEASMWSHKAAVRATYEVIDLGSSDPPTFEQELVKLLNKHGMEKGSNTADWILCEVLRQMLIAFDLAFDANDNEDEYAVLDFAKRAVRALDVGVRLRERQGEPRALSSDIFEAVRQSDKVDPMVTGELTVPLIDRTGETPQVIGEATVVEKADGFHIEASIPETPEGMAPTAVGFSMSDYPEPTYTCNHDPACRTRTEHGLLVDFPEPAQFTDTSNKE